MTDVFAVKWWPEGSHEQEIVAVFSSQEKLAHWISTLPEEVQDQLEDIRMELDTCHWFEDWEEDEE